MGRGTQCAVEVGISVMLQLCVNNLDMMNVSITCCWSPSNITLSPFILVFSPRLHHFPLSRVTPYFYLMDDIDCHGNETVISLCHHRGVYNHYCYKEAGVMCNSKFCFMAFFCSRF